MTFKSGLGSQIKQVCVRIMYTPDDKKKMPTDQPTDIVVYSEIEPNISFLSTEICVAEVFTQIVLVFTLEPKIKLKKKKWKKRNRQTTVHGFKPTF